MTNDYDRARDFAVRYLGRAPRTRRQLRDKLTDKEFSTEAIDNVIQFLTQKGYLDDVTFAKNYISHKTRINNYGRRRIIVGLLQKGVSKEDIRAAYNQTNEDDSTGDETAAATRALAKRTARKNINEIKNDPKEKQRLVAFLMRRGFSYDIVKKVMQGYLKEVEP